MGGEPAVPTHQHATLDTWCSVHNRRRRNLRRGHISALYQPTTQHILDHIQQQTGSQLTKLSDNAGYDEDTQCYGHVPGHINEL
jgi:transcription initiation factor IIE alpha subunit